MLTNPPTYYAESFDDEDAAFDGFHKMILNEIECCRLNGDEEDCMDIELILDKFIFEWGYKGFGYEYILVEDQRRD